MLRAIPAQWFKLLVPRTMLARAVEVLAETGLVELEPGDDRGKPLKFDRLREGLVGFRQMRQRFHGHWPRPIRCRGARDEMLETVFERSMKTLGRWEEQALPLIERSESLARDVEELERLRELLDPMRNEEIDFTRLVQERPSLAALVFVMPPGSEVPGEAGPLLYHRVDTPRHSYLLILDERDSIRRLAEALGGRRGRVLTLPSWLRGSPEESLALTEERLAGMRQQLAKTAEQMESLNGATGIAGVLGELMRVEWLVESLRGINVDDYFAKISGWTSDHCEGRTLHAALAGAGIPSVLHFTAEPEGRIPPTLTRNPFWVRPFEVFTRLLGTPGRGEAEPSVLVAVIAPLLFGYMFGDIGQGAVLIAAGLWLRRRWPACGMLVSGGLCSVLFGFVFGSVFAMEGLIAPLWTHPLEAPISVMIAPLFGGAGIIVISMALNGLAHHWQGRVREWLSDEAGLLVFYVSALTAVFHPAPGVLALAALGLIWQGVGAAWVGRRNHGAVLVRGLATLPERLMQLAVNTLSFVRVGAFALAHAGLGQAVASLADATERPLTAALTLILGNAVIILIEGLVVAVQTTRLVLFEFFIRFLRTAGRPFQPLSLPATW